MALLPQGFSFSRKALPVIAAIGLVLAVLFILTGIPNRDLSEPAEQPPRATGALANAARVAGVGVVEPSSEIIDIGTALAGLVTDVRVTPGQFVSKGEVLFVVDGRSDKDKLIEELRAERDANVKAAAEAAQEAEAEAWLAQKRAAEEAGEITPAPASPFGEGEVKDESE